MIARFPCGPEAETEQRDGRPLRAHPGRRVSQDDNRIGEAREGHHGLHNCYNRVCKQLEFLSLGSLVPCPSIALEVK